MRFRSRLVGAVIGLTLLALGGAFTMVSRLVNNDQQRQLDRALLREAHEEALEAARGGSGTRLMIDDGPGPYADDIGPLTKYGAIYAADGALLSATDSFLGHAPPLTELPHALDRCFNLWFRREHLRAVLTEVPHHPGHLLLLAAPRHDLDGDAAFLRRAMLIVFAVAATWTTLLAIWVIRRLTLGHAAVAEVARRVAGGDLSARVSPDRSDPDMRQLGEDVNKMIDRLGELLASQEEFITHAAHELRSPLTTLDGELALALRRSRDEAGYRQAIEEARDSARRLKQLAESLLRLARLDGHDGEPSGRLALDAVLEHAWKTVAATAAERQVVLARERTDCQLVGRAGDLERLFCNLFENAIRHSPAGGHVQVTVRETAARVKIHVTDQGTGVLPNERERIFEPFYRSPTVYGTTGHGLGLAIARKVARTHGGDLTLGANSEGAEFIVELRR